MIDEVISSSPLGKSDHTVLTWNLYADVKCLNGASERKVCSNARLNFKKGDYEGMYARLTDKNWSSLKDLDVEAMWKQLKDTIAMVMDQRSMDRKLRSLTIVYSTNAANGLICAKFRTQISLNISVTSVKLRAFLVDE